MNRSHEFSRARGHSNPGDAERALRSGGGARQVPLSAVAGLHAAKGEQAGHHEAAPGGAEPACQMLAQGAGKTVVGDVVVAQMQDRDRLGAPSRSERGQRGVEVCKGFCRGQDGWLEAWGRFRGCQERAGHSGNSGLAGLDGGECAQNGADIRHEVRLHARNAKRRHLQG